MPVTPVNLLGFKMIDRAPSDECRFRRIALRRRQALHRLDRQQRCRIRAGGQRRRSSNNPETEFQKSPTFHDVPRVPHDG
jgi:hypothetical protein